MRDKLLYLLVILAMLASAIPAAIPAAAYDGEGGMAIKAEPIEVIPFPEKGTTDNLSVRQGQWVLESPLESEAEPAQPREGQTGWQEIMTDGFEGSFPGNWVVGINDGAADAYWGKDGYRSNSGSYSAFCAKSGADGVDPPANYPNDMVAWMIYGPFSLADATDAELNYWLWLETESEDYDRFWITASTDGANFYGGYWWGSTDWLSMSFDLTDVPTLGNLCGESQVWIAFIFDSDSSDTYQGAFVDDVVLRKYTTPVEPTWTFMVYLDGDNNLEGSEITNFNLMEYAADNENVNVIVQFDRIPGYDSSNGDWTTTRRYKVKYDTDIDNFASYTLDVDYWDLGELNMADPNTLSDFALWVKTNYPADHYCLVLSNHGSGWKPRGIIEQAVPKGIIADDTSGDYMYTAELGNALNSVTSGGTEKLDVLFLDACLMQMIEVGYEVKDYSQYLVASEYVGWGPGPYHDYVSYFTSTTTAEELAIAIVNYYHSWLSGNIYAHTMSAVDLSQYGLASVVDDFAQALAAGLSTYRTQIESSRSACQKFWYDSYIDLYHFAFLIDQNIADTTIQTAAQAVMTAVNNAVIAEAHENGSGDEYYPLDDAHGISIYFPASESDIYYSNYNSSNLAFVADKGWDEFLAAFFGESGGSISGNVTETDGTTAIEGATVMVWDVNQVERLPWAPYAETTTNADGDYSIANLPEGGYVVAAVAEDHERLYYQGIHLWSDADTVTVNEGQDTEVNFALGPGGTISGTVKNYNGSATLADMSVITQVPNVGGFFSAALTDASGDYTLDGLPYGNYYVTSPAPVNIVSGDSGYIPERWEEQPISGGDAITIDQNNANHTGKDFTLEQGGIISGHVDDGSNPIPGTLVQVFDHASLSGSWVNWGGGLTDENGNYETCGLPEGEYGVRAMVLAGGYADEWYDGVYHQGYASPVEVHVSDNITVNFSLEPGGSISGTVKDAVSSATLAGVSVECRRITDSDRDWHGVTSNSSGGYTISGLPYGEYEVRSPGGSHWGSGDDNYIIEYYNEGTGETVTVGDGQSPGNVNFTLEQGGSISGNVKDGDNDPIVGLHLYASDNVTNQWVSGTNTDASGDYTISGLPQGGYIVRTCASCVGLNYIDETYGDSVTVTPPGDHGGIDFVLEQGGSISGNVKNGDNNPIVNLHLYASDNVTGQWMAGTNTDTSGNYTISGLPEGGYIVRACASCSGHNYPDEYYDNVYSWGDATSVTVMPPGDHGNINFVLEQGGSISGVVLDQVTSGLVNDASSGNISLEVGWHKFVYRHQENGGGQASRAAFKAPGDADWRWFSTSELEIRTTPDHGADSGILLTNKRNNWGGPPGSHSELVRCVEVDATEDAGWYGSSIVDTVNQDENIHGNDDYYTSYYKGHFYVDTAGTWHFSTDSDDASEITIDDEVVAYWYGGHGPADRWEHKISVDVELYDTGEWVASTRGNADGSYTVVNLPSADYRVSARASGYADEFFNDTLDYNQAVRVTVDAPGETENVDFSLLPGGTISGHVYATEGGAAIEGAQIDAVVYDTITGYRAHLGWAQTDADGYYITSGLPSGEYGIWVRADGYATEWWQDTYYQDEAAPISITVPGHTRNIDFNLEQGGSISGNVQDSDNNPIYDLHVYVTDSVTNQWVAGANTDASGDYTIPGLPAGGYTVRACASCSGLNYVDQTYGDSVTVTPPGDTGNINFILEQGGSISGNVKDSDNNPIAGLRVHASDNETGQFMGWADTDASGDYTIYGLPEGGYIVVTCTSCSGLNYIDEYYDNVYSWDDADSVTVTPPGEHGNIDFILDMGATISGHVYATEGGAIEGAQIDAVVYDTITGHRVHLSWTQTDEEGYYITSGLPTGEYGIWVRADGYANEWWQDTYYQDEATSISVTAPENKTGFDFYLEAGGSISGNVQDSDSNPIYNLHVHALDPDTHQWMAGADTDASGNYTITGLPAGSYTVAACATCAGLNYVDEFYDNVHNWDDAVSVTVTPPGDHGGINFTLDTAGSISGHVQDSAGNPIANFHLYASDNVTGLWMACANTDDYGNYTIYGLPAGGYIVTACANCAGLPYVDEYYDNVHNWQDATSVTVIPPSDHGGINFTMELAVTRHLPAAVAPGNNFDVIITFTAPADEFNSIVLHDEAPNGWQVAVNEDWCNPTAQTAKTPETNQAEYSWLTYDEGESFTAVYQVTVPAEETEDTYNFPDGWLHYFIVGDEYNPEIIGDWQIQVVNGSTISGTTYEVTCDVLPGATISLYKDEVLKAETTSDGNGDYTILATETGTYTVVVSKDGYRDETQTKDIVEMGVDYELNFAGNSGIIPNELDGIYFSFCMNKYLYGTGNCAFDGIKFSKVMNAYLYAIIP